MRRAYTYRPAQITAALFGFKMRPASGLLAWTDDEKAAWSLSIATSNLAGAEDRFASACGALGQANRLHAPMRRFHQAKAFRAINAARGQLRRARLALVAAEAATAALPLFVAGEHRSGPGACEQREAA